MFNKYFGNYILTKNIVTNEQLKKILEKQSVSKVKLGVLAIEAGYMNALQVEKVNKLQTTKDMRFGEIAISEGFLSDEHLSELLSSQKNSHVMLGQILVDEGILSYSDYEKVLAEYKGNSGFSDKEIEILKSNNTDAIVDMFIDMQKLADASLFKEYVELFIRNIVRFIDNNIIIGKPYQVDAYPYKNYISQDIVGENILHTGISATDDVFIKFASIYTQETLTELDKMTLDSIGEFMNCQNGLFISNLYHQNINCDLTPQKYDENNTLKQKNHLFILPCTLSFGTVDIILNI